ncbi:hypothetical protein [Streptomyces sp. SLBN-31]|uniref:hypothetical protein n=1 Tax=Streptomyces sp. SLBN-31 TaxID=2768444 RepID=UPI0011675572|nr:hypothetical protein [Streptomyces sp. SLBN-31]TQJ85506.1 hypothetical protein FBY22_4286 [Streptomyces sp. SLBN-31]
MTTHDDVTPPPAEEEEATRRLEPADAQDATLHLDPTDTRPSSDGPVGSGTSGGGPVDADDDYSATVLASHWIQRPELDSTLVEEPSVPAPPSPRPDRVDGTVLRFGPGVTAAIELRHHRTLATASPAPPSPQPRRRRLRRHALPTLVVLAVLALLLWQRSAPSVQVSEVAVTTRPTVLGCDGTADIVGLVTTNGRAGTLSYRWVRSDGTASGVLHEVMVRGQKHARLHLRWTYRGKGHRTAQAELRILTPTHRESTARFTYHCA